jgi:hypothetical protein
MSASQRVLIFLHVPKTAGRTLAGVIKRQYRADTILALYESDLLDIPPRQIDDLRVVGHFYFRAHTFLPKLCSHITLLRDPIELTMPGISLTNRSASTVLDSRTTCEASRS